MFVLTSPKFFPTLILHTVSGSGTGVSSRSLLCPLRGCNPNTNDREKKVGLYVSFDSVHENNSISKNFH